MKPIKPILFIADDNHLHQLVSLSYELCQKDPCADCSMRGYCLNHEYGNGDFCLCDAIAHRMGIEFEIGEDLFRFERAEYDQSLQGKTINVMPRFKKARKYVQNTYIVLK